MWVLPHSRDTPVGRDFDRVGVSVVAVGPYVGRREALQHALVGEGLAKCLAVSIEWLLDRYRAGLAHAVNEVPHQLCVTCAIEGSDDGDVANRLLATEADLITHGAGAVLLL